MRADATADPSADIREPTLDPTAHSSAAATADSPADIREPTLDPVAHPSADATADSPADIREPTLDPTAHSSADATADPPTDIRVPALDPTADSSADATADSPADIREPRLDLSTDSSTDSSADIRTKARFKVATLDNSNTSRTCGGSATDLSQYGREIEMACRAITLGQVSSEDMVADILPNAIAGVRFNSLRARVLGLSPGMAGTGIDGR